MAHYHADVNSLNGNKEGSMELILHSLHPDGQRTLALHGKCTVRQMPLQIPKPRSCFFSFPLTIKATSRTMPSWWVSWMKLPPALWRWEPRSQGSIVALQYVTHLVTYWPAAPLVQRRSRWFGHAARRPDGELIKDLLLPTRGAGEFRSVENMGKADLEPLSGSRVFSYARWRKDWVKVSSEPA